MENINSHAVMRVSSSEMIATQTGARKHGLSESESGEGSATGKKRTRVKE